MSNTDRVHASGPSSRILGMDLLLQFARNPGDFLLGLARDYPDLSLFHIMGQPVVSVSSADLVREVFIDQVDVFHRAALQKRLLQDLLGNGLVMTDGEFWRKQRKLMQPTFHAKRIEAFAQTMLDYTQQVLSAWQSGAVYDMDPLLTRLALQIACKTLFDVNIEQDSDRIGAAMHEIQQVVAEGFAMTAFPALDKLPLPANLRKKRAIETVVSIMDRIIEERRAEQRDHGDLLSMMILTTDEQGNGMSPRQLRDEALTLFIAGHETTAKAIVWALYTIAQHPDIQTRLYEEVVRIGGTEPLSPIHLRQLSYTEQVVKEAMRLYPSTWLVLREAVQETTLAGTRIPKGTMLVISPFVLHREARYFDQPEQFNPDRFSDNAAAPIPRYAYIPFITGPHVCLGSAFAMMEAQIVLASIIQRYQLQVAPSGGTTLQFAGTLVPASAVNLTVTRRAETVPSS